MSLSHVHHLCEAEEGGTQEAGFGGRERAQPGPVGAGEGGREEEGGVDKARASINMYGAGFGGYMYDPEEGGKSPTCVASLTAHSQGLGCSPKSQSLTS